MRGKNKHISYTPIQAIALVCIILAGVSQAKSQSTDVSVFRALVIEGNKKTKPQVFLREMGIKKGDTLESPDSLAILWQKRFSSLNLFNWVRAQIKHDTVFVQVLERIYVWGMPRLSWADRNFNVWWQTKDPKRLIYGGTVFFNNLGGQNYSAYVTVISGYNHLFEMGIKSPFLSHSKGWALELHAQHWSNHELWYTAKNDSLQFLRLDDQKIQKNTLIEAIVKRRLSYFSRFELSIGFSQISVNKAVESEVQGYLFNPTQQKEYFTKMEFVRDWRDQRDYPSKGGIFRVGVKQSAMPVTLGNAKYIADVFLRISHFQPITHSGKWVFASLFAVNALNRSMPYRFARQLGYQSDYVRGYEPYVGDGQGFMLGKTALRYALWNNKVLKLGDKGIIGNYLHAPISAWFNIFADAGQVIHPYDVHLNPLSGNWYRGVGLGLDVTVWYSAMARFEYSRNHLGQGIFNVSFKNAF